VSAYQKAACPSTAGFFDLSPRNFLTPFVYRFYDLAKLPSSVFHPRRVQAPLRQTICVYPAPGINSTRQLMFTHFVRSISCGLINSCKCCSCHKNSTQKSKIPMRALDRRVRPHLGIICRCSYGFFCYWILRNDFL